MEPSERVRTTLAGRHPDRPARGEVWLGPDVFKGAGTDDNLTGQIAVRRRLGMDLLWMPAGRGAERHDQGYRLFAPEDLARAKESCPLFVGAVIDGPWQRLAAEKGLMALFTGLAQDRCGLARALARHADEAASLVEECLVRGTDGLLVADDLAGGSGPLISPSDVEALLGPFYNTAARAARSAGVPALFHCCGNPKGLMDIWARAGFQGLAAAQTDLIGTADIIAAFGPRPLLAGGLDAAVAAAAGPDDALARQVEPLEADFRLILSTSGGIFTWQEAKRLADLYRLWPEN